MTNVVLANVTCTLAEAIYSSEIHFFFAKRLLKVILLKLFNKIT